jgi:hypothetical protein
VPCTRSAPSTYFGFVSYLNTEGQLAAVRPLFDDIQRVLYGLGGRPHWGKYFTPQLVRDADPDGFTQFRRDLERFDPRRLFQNDTFYRALGLPTE